MDTETKRYVKKKGHVLVLDPESDRPMDCVYAKSFGRTNVVFPFIETPSRRVVACVDACDGFPSPEITIAAMKAAILSGDKQALDTVRTELEAIKDYKFYETL
jgi:hypothetical protein